GRDGDETGGDFNDVESEPFAFGNVFPYRHGSLRKDTLDEAAGRNEHIVFVAKLDNLSHRFLRHEAEGSSGEFQRIDVKAHCLEEIFEMAPSIGRVIRSANFG